MALLFRSKSKLYSEFSNLSEIGFRLNDVKWPSVEHYYQAQKYAGSEVHDQIRTAPSPLKAMKMGQNRSLVVRADWDDAKVEVMRRAVSAKFQQNRRVRDLLLSAGDEELVHSSSSDLFWGQNDDGDGENILGKILMDVREELAESL